MMTKRVPVIIGCIEVIILACCFILYFSRNVSSIMYEKPDMIESINGDSIDVFTPQFDLGKGVYFVEVDYSSGDDLAVSEVFKDIVNYNSYEENYMRSDVAKLMSYRDHVAYRLYMNNACSGIQIRNTASAGSGLIINSVLIRYQPLKTAFYFSGKLLLVLLILNLCFVLLYFKKYSVEKSDKNPVRILILCTLVMICCLPLTVPFFPDGHDATFHMLRLAGLADGIMRGDLPVRIQGIWLNGYGAATGVTYPDLFLYPFAILYALGMPLYIAYKFYLLAVNIATVLISYYCFKNISNDEGVAMFATVLYSCSMWRLIDIYSRESLGEYTAMAFMPLVALGLYEIYHKNNRGNSLLLGMSGIVLSHPLTLLMVAEFVFLFCLIRFKETFSKKIFLLLLRQGILFTLLNAWTLVPLLNYYMLENIGVSSTNKNIQGHGLYFSQLFSLDNGIMLRSEKYTATQEMPLTIGISLTAVLLISIAILICHKSIKRQMVIVAALDVLAIYMATAYFPYAWFMDHINVLYKIVAAIQFPWRYLTIATILSSILAIMIIQNDGIKSVIGEWLGVKTIMLILIAITFFQSLGYLSDFVSHQTTRITCLSEGALDSFDNVSNFTLAYVDSEEMKDDSILLSDKEKLEVDVLEQNGTKYHIHIKNDSLGDESIDLPIMGYSQYAVDDKQIAVGQGHNKRVRLTVPAGYIGDVKVRYQEPILWRICELLSLGTLLWLFYCRRKNIGMK